MDCLDAMNARHRLFRQGKIEVGKINEYKGDAARPFSDEEWEKAQVARFDTDGYRRSRIRGPIKCSKG